MSNINTAAPTGRALAEFIAFANRIAQGKREDAGYAGSWSDNGAREMEENIKTWHAGLEGKIPESLKETWKNYQNSIDPEYQKYQELKKRFG
jgi:hypothetical protein